MFANYLNSNGVPATVNGNQRLLNLLPEDPNAMFSVLVAEEDAEGVRRLIADRPGRRWAARERLWRIQMQSRAYRLFRRCMIVMFIACMFVLVLLLLTGFHR